MIAAGAIGLLAAFLILRMLRLVVVADHEGQVVSAATVAGNGATQPMHRAPGGLFLTIRRVAGEVVIRCRDGSAARGSHVTSCADERLNVTGRCRIDVRQDKTGS